MKVITETVETTAEIDLTDEMTPFVIPPDFEMPPGGLNLRWPDDRFEQDRRLQDYKGFAAVAFARANKVNRITMDSPNARYGIMASGKSYEDIRQALRELGITEEVAAKIGLRLYKIGMPWPLEPEGVHQFAVGLEEIFIVEERREIVENQVKQVLFNWRDDVRPRIVGKMDDHDKRFLTFAAELSVSSLASSLTERLLRLDLNPEIKSMLRAKADWFNGREATQVQAVAPITRTPYFCSGCPHNTSTKVPEGSRAFAGIGCHFMALWMDRSTETFTHMGGEGVPWVGVAPFTKEQHVFANLGDGTYFHSGSLAIRQAVASGANITYKLLYNDATAMTGGQHVDGELSPQQITFQMHAEGIRHIYLVSEKPELYPASDIAPGVITRHRDELDAVMKECRELKGTSAIVFVQTCAAEKRRRRKRGLMEDPARRVMINPAVCEGCGDCSVQSNCISVEPLETEMGRKRTINQSSCNKDYSCLKGFCPSFVTIDGGKPRRRAPAELGDIGDVAGAGLAAVARQTLQHRGRRRRRHRRADHRRAARHGRPYRGQGQHDPRHVRPCAKGRGGAEPCPALRAHARRHLLAHRHRHRRSRDGRRRGGGGLEGHDHALRVRPHHRHHQQPHHPDRRFHPQPRLQFPEPQGRERAGDLAAQGLGFRRFHQAGRSAARRLHRHQHHDDGLCLSARACCRCRREAIEQAIEVNGVSIKMNTQAFRLGRLAAADPARLDAMMQGQDEAHAPKSLDAMTLDEIIAHRCEFLTAYQSKRLAKRYRKLVDQVRDAATKGGYGDALPRAVAINYAKLLAYKDEYEVARLFTDGKFEQQLRDQFEGDFKFSFNLAPPILGGGKDALGRPKKRAFGRLDAAGVQACWRSCASCAAPRSTFSRAAPTASSSAI